MIIIIKERRETSEPAQKLDLASIKRWTGPEEEESLLTFSRSHDQEARTQLVGFSDSLSSAFDWLWLKKTNTFLFNNDTFVVIYRLTSKLTQSNVFLHSSVSFTHSGAKIPTHTKMSRYGS